MIRGLLWKSWSEIWPTTLLLAILLCAAEALLSYVIPTYQQRTIGSVLAQSDVAKGFLRALMGSDAPISMGPELFMTFPWAHPVVLALLWGHATICCSRVPAGEVDRGTIDVLLGLPVSRWGLFGSELIAWVGSLALLLGLTLAANRIGTAYAPAETRPAFGRAAIVAVNCFAMAWAVGGFSMLVSSLSDRRGRALTIVFVTLLVSFLLNFLAEIWPPVKGMAWLSILKYYRPIVPLRDGTWPAQDILTLGAIGGVCWSAAGVVFSRRDLCSL